MSVRVCACASTCIPAHAIAGTATSVYDLRLRICIQAACYNQLIQAFLRGTMPAFWSKPETAGQLDLTLTVFDRFNGRLVHGERGDADELAPAEPVHVPAMHSGDSPHFVQVQLYCYTHRDGTGWHYEWVSSM